MRPVRLVLEGFTPFRDRVEVDFADVDLFALVGPTGSGKSSVIDGITFALYGSVARYGDERLVGPVINQRSSSATVDLTFTVGDDEYRIHRQAVRTKEGGGSVKEARLEHGDDVLAAGKEVTKAVEDLLGLSFGQFTTCVVLPQGEFARFLHETPAAREALLKRLLELGLYDQVGQRARSRAKDAEAQVRLLDQQLEELRGESATAAEPEELARRIDGLEALLASVEAAQPELAELAAKAEEATAQLSFVEHWLDLLGGVSAPADLDTLGEVVATAQLELDAGHAARVEAEQKLEAVESAAAALPDRSRLEAARERRERRDALAVRVTDGENKTAEASAAAAAAEALATVATAARDAAVEALAAAEREHRAHSLAADLVAGQPCPVCHQEVHELPTHDLADLKRLRDEVAEAGRDFTEADEALTKALDQVTSFTARLDQLREELVQLDREVSLDPSPEGVAAALDQWVELDGQIAGARSVLQAARDQEKGAMRRREKVEKMMQSAWGTFDDARDRLGALDPPAVTRSDLAASWSTLLVWVEEQTSTHTGNAAIAREIVTVAEAHRQQRIDQVAAACRAAGVEPGTGAPRDAVVEALAETRALRQRADERRETLARRLDEREALEHSRQVADSLGLHLKSGGFVSWLLQGTLEQLVVGATERLRSLSQGRYSLAVDDKGGFLVIDQANADERRLARTLSGGETFLASLALALSLADEVARVSAVGTPRLESIFLDEGFGTLDPESLDIVVSAIEDLQATGRLVGLVSHVPEIAERVPVRFEVTKGSVTSTVERVVV